MAYTTIDDPTIYFNTVLYTGNATARSITGVGFQPDWLWIKKRSESGNHRLVDSVRGATKELQSDNTDAEATTSGQVTSFDSDGFSLGTSNSTNKNSITFVSWNWKTGTSFTNDASATGIGTIDSTGSVSTTAGFSIISFTGQTGTVAHGLGVKPSMIILKCRAIANNFVIQHKGLTGGMDDNALIFTTSAEIGAPTAEPTTSVFTVNNQIAENNDNIAYIFSDIKGYSKFGKYTGNGNADGTFVYTGFKPAWVLLKQTDSAGSWNLYDNKRNGFNVDNDLILVDATNAEANATFIDFLSNGFKIRDTDDDRNASGGSYIYMVFAESPFVNSNGVPNNAR